VKELIRQAHRLRWTSRANSRYIGVNDFTTDEPSALVDDEGKSLTFDDDAEADQSALLEASRSQRRRPSCRGSAPRNVARPRPTTT
jgi:hypothetical protein